MGYLHISNLYRDQTVLGFREAYALEKIHGTSAHVAYTPDKVELPLMPDGAVLRFFSGGEPHEKFLELFGSLYPEPWLLEAGFREIFGPTPVIVYGEAYGGKQQGMRATYGGQSRFVCFDVKVSGIWLPVPKAEKVCRDLALPFVHYERGAADLEWLDGQRDAPSVQAVRNGIEGERMREGIVIRPLVELQCGHGNRVIAKHKRAEFRERKSIPQVDPTKREILDKADAIAEEWVTPMRLTHVLDKLGNPHDLTRTGEVIKATVEDVCREASGEIVESKAARKAIGARAARLYKWHLEAALREPAEAV